MARTPAMRADRSGAGHASRDWREVDGPRLGLAREVDEHQGRRISCVRKPASCLSGWRLSRPGALTVLPSCCAVVVNIIRRPWHRREAPSLPRGIEAAAFRMRTATLAAALLGATFPPHATALVQHR